MREIHNYGNTNVTRIGYKKQYRNCDLKIEVDPIRTTLVRKNTSRCIENYFKRFKKSVISGTVLKTNESIRF